MLFPQVPSFPELYSLRAAYRCGAVAVSCISGIRYMGGTYSYYGGSGWSSTVADYGNHIHAHYSTYSS